MSYLNQVLRFATVAIDTAVAEANRLEEEKMAADCRGYMAQKAAEIINDGIGQMRWDLASSDEYMASKSRKVVRELRKLDHEVKKYPLCRLCVPSKTLNYFDYVARSEGKYRATLYESAASAYEKEVVTFAAGTSGIVGVSVLAKAIGAATGIGGSVALTAGVVFAGVLSQKDASRTMNSLDKNPILPLAPESIAAMAEEEAKQWARMCMACGIK